MLCVLPMPEVGQTEQTSIDTMLSIDDIYQKVEEEKALTRQRTQGQIALTADINLAKRKFSKRGDFLDTWSLPNLSRSPTARSDTPSYASPHRSMSIVTDVAPSTRTRKCYRAQSAMSARSEPVRPLSVNTLSQQCCDVLGPRMCHECYKLKRQETEFQQLETTLPDLHTSEENFAATFLVRHYMPEINNYQAQTKLARGEINRVGFKDWLRRLHDESKVQAKEHNETRKKMKTRQLPCSFFSNIKDLNKKLFTGRVDRKAVLRPSWAPDMQGYKTTLDMTNAQSFSEKIMPMFVSPRSTQAYFRKALVTRAKFDPPLLPTIQQNTEPTFFAGSDKPYKLPDRLPDTLLDQDDDDDADF